MNTKSFFLAVILSFTAAGAVPSPAQTPAPPAVQDEQKLLTRTYRVPPDFLMRTGETQGLAPADPFAERAVPANAARKSAKEVLEFYKISFAAKGSSASFDPASSRLVVTNTAAQLGLVENLIEAMNAGGSVAEGFVLFEIISLPPLAARKALIAHPVEADLYQWLNAEIEKKDSGVVLEHLHSLRIRGGQRSKVEGVDEYPYATELDPSQIPQNISLAGGPPVPPQSAGNGKIFTPWPYSPVTPTAFARRQLGWTSEAELTFSEDRKTADLNLAPNLTKLIAQVPQGLAGETTQPVFQTQKSTSQVHVWVGKPALVSTLSPASDTGVPGNTNKDNRVWLLFVTVTRPQ